MVATENKSMAKTDEPSLTYRTEDHVAIIFQLYGSIWGKVLPYCIVNTIVAFGIGYFDNANIFDFSFSDKGHGFMSTMVSFLIITRSHIAHQRYMEARALLSDIMRSCRELVQHTVTFTRYEHGKKAQKWRADIARRTCSLLRTVVTLLEYDTKGEHVWQVAELSKAEKQALLLAVGGSNERSPLVLSIFLRTSIASHVENLTKPLEVNQELILLACTAQFVSAYHGLMKLITTPFPFPLVQMTRTFLFVWVFTLPFALNSDIDDMIPLLIIVFFITYGFIGLEFVSMELDDPFGNDPNDFDVKGLAEVVFDDIFITVQDIDGKEASMALKKSVEMPLNEQIKSAVRSHKRYTRVKSWGGDEFEIDKIAADVTPLLRSPAVTDDRQPLISGGHQQSKLIEAIRGQHLESANSDESDFNSKARFSSYYGSLSEPPELQNDDHGGTLSEKHLEQDYEDQEEENESESGSYYSSSSSSDKEHIRSSLINSVRDRLNTDASIEVFGVNEKVRFDSRSNSLHVSKSKVGASPGAAYSKRKMPTFERQESDLSDPDDEGTNTNE